MSNFNFHNKTFILLENSEKGKVNAQTKFQYQQTENLVTADYSGGTIKYGKIIAKLEGDQLNMLYQCITVDDELKAGKAMAKITLNEKGKIRLSLHWEWLGGKQERGVSEYIEE